MTHTYVIADTHFHHKNIIGHSGRPFPDVASMNRSMVERWNCTVSNNDIVYHLGDVAMWKAKDYAIVRELKGHKRLIMGNHDTQPMEVYSSVGFERVQASLEGNGYVLTHIPIHDSQLQRFALNIHGHIHQDIVTRLDVGKGVYVRDDRYKCVSVEHIDYTPVLLTSLFQERNT